MMDQAGVTQGDAFLDSHYHEDHFGGIDALRTLGVSILESYDRGKRDTVSAPDKTKAPIMTTCRRSARTRTQ